MARLSGPLLDRFDIMIDVAELASHHLIAPQKAEPTAVIRTRILAARHFATKRASAEDSLSATAVTYLKTHLEALQISARGYHKILGVARTIADLEASDKIEPPHLSEAISYRKMRLLS